MKTSNRIIRIVIPCFFVLLLTLVVLYRSGTFDPQEELPYTPQVAKVSADEDNVHVQMVYREPAHSLKDNEWLSSSKTMVDIIHVVRPVELPVIRSFTYSLPRSSFMSLKLDEYSWVKSYSAGVPATESAGSVSNTIALGNTLND